MLSCLQSYISEGIALSVILVQHGFAQLCCTYKRLRIIKREKFDFITEVESVYCAVRTVPLYNTHTFRL